MINKIRYFVFWPSSVCWAHRIKKTKSNKINKGFDKQDDLKLDNPMYDVLTAYRKGALPTSLAEMLIWFYDPEASASLETFVCVQALVVSGLDLAKPETISTSLDENTALKLTQTREFVGLDHIKE